MSSLIQLQYALAVDHYRHFGKAAQACHVSQPTLSQQLQKFEDELGVILFDRMKKPILPTPEGKAVLEQAAVVMREFEKLEHIAKQSKEGDVVGEFRLGVIPTVASNLLPLFLKHFAKAYPKVQLLIEELKTESILEALEEDKLDGAILATPIEGADLKTRPLYYEPFYVYLSSDHELLRQKHIARKQLKTNEMWLLQDGHCFKDQVLNFCGIGKSEGTELSNIRFQSGSLDTLKRLVQSNRGHTMIPALMALSLRKDEQTAHVRPFADPVPTREISLIYRRDHWKLAIIRALEETIDQYVPKSLSRHPQAKQLVLEVSETN